MVDPEYFAQGEPVWTLHIDFWPVLLFSFSGIVHSSTNLSWWVMVHLVHH